MKFVDYVPSAAPSLEQQRDALQKGLGRALQWALRRRLDDEPLLEACLRDQRFDMQVEGPRGDWLWRMVQAVGTTERFRVPILHALYDLSDDRGAEQLCELARCYAERGDETFRTRLYEIVEQKPCADSPWLGEKEIVAVDGEQAFLFAVGVRGRRLAGREWEWDDGSLIDLATERFGEGRVSGLLEASSDLEVNRFRESWRLDKQRRPEQQRPVADRERVAATPVEEIIRAAAGESKYSRFRVWGRYADESDLRRILPHLWAELDPKAIANLLKVFSVRALPEFDGRLIELCRHSDAEVQRRAFSALEQNAHPLIREFALTELQGGLRDGSVAALFINNYRQGDEQRILEAMAPPEDECDLHWLLLDVIKVLEKNPEADCSRLAVVGYALTPCETCRLYATRLLLNKQIAPEWLKEECRHDSVRDCRELAAKSAGSTNIG